MFDYSHYVPILKGKLGEYTALQVLADEIKLGLTPLLEIPPVPWDFENEVESKTIDAHLAPVTERIETAWGTDRPIFVDLTWIDQARLTRDGTHVLTYIFNEGRQKELQLVPVTGLARPDEYQDAVLNAVQLDDRGICLRLESADFDDLDNLTVRLEARLRFFDLTPASVDLMLDFKEIAAELVSTTRLGMMSILSAIPTANDWRSLTIAASAFPENLTAVSAASEELLPRTEWAVWLGLFARREKLSRLPSFGDYAISGPDLVELDMRLMKMSANLRYTTDSDWLILKGRNVRKYGYDQFNALCKKLVDRAEYSGEGFSWGDGYIARCARDEDGPGNATTWRKVGTSHHLTKVVEQIAALAEP